MIISDCAKRVNTLIGKDVVRHKFAPPDLFNRRQDTGKSAIDIFAEHGLYLTKAKNDRVLGWYNIKEWLKPIQRKDEQTGEDTTHARLKIFSTCHNLIRTLPQLQHDDKHPNDVATEPHEITHAPDAIRYFCAERPVATYIPKQQQEDEDEDIPFHSKNTFFT